MRKNKKSIGSRALGNRTIIGIICIVAALAICFGIAPMVNKLRDGKAMVVRVSTAIEKGAMITDANIVDCTSNLENNVLSAIGIEKADQVIRLASPDLSSISFFLSQKGVYEDAKYRWDAHIVGLNTPNADAYMPIEEARSHLKDVSFTVPYSQNIKEQLQKGTLYAPAKDKRFDSRLKEIAGKVVEYEAQ